MAEQAKGLVDWVHRNKTLLGLVYLVTWAVIWSFWPDLGEGFDRLGLMLVAAGLLEGDSVKRAQRLGVRRDDSRPDGLEADYRNLLKPSK